MNTVTNKGIEHMFELLFQINESTIDERFDMLAELLRNANRSSDYTRTLQTYLQDARETFLEDCA